MQDQVETEAFLRGRLPDDITSSITGNTSVELKEIPVKWLAIFRNNGSGFGGNISARINVVDVSVVANGDDPLKTEGKVTCEIEVTPDMCNSNGILNEGCIIYLIDECSTLAMVVINAHTGLNTPPGVSQTINTFFHFPGVIGTKLRIISTSLASGEETNTGRCDVWDKDKHRLIATGIQQTTLPSRPAKWLKG
ncbi:hypothetical protein JR316_0004365 [Psilocybe cubensis]|uniref:Thioesterase domain-containing protein n=2 Tax=Psilocybe cubensis TaxID=181762 RepID=A0A8H7Y070_PSICU|nr:hypothetical protein JR316_0004365 [Psilocybe cubensis]KAH9482267.1 hypothetical protein JR316_0004365 [Psilocybe cubensis]